MEMRAFEASIDKVDLRKVRLVNRLNICFAVLLLSSALVRGGPAQSATQAAGSETKITAKKYEFDPNVITVKSGERVKLVITALDHDHGFKLEAFKVNERLKKGTPTTIEFTADKVGTFAFECSHFCGVGHGKMKGTLVVTE